jgi:hypothetical protein
VELTPLELQIGELDVAIDRLRSLYDQYFMGIERIEPAVPRKDVERKIHVLRKEQIRNTALRFRFQMILQRYNTFQSHWQRICREIENGTYKRHVYRVDRRRSAPPPAAEPEPVAPPARDFASELEELDREFAPAPLKPIEPPAARVRPAAKPIASRAPSPTSLPEPRPPPLPSAARFSLSPPVTSSKVSLPPAIAPPKGSLPPKVAPPKAAPAPHATAPLKAAPAPHATAPLKAAPAPHATPAKVPPAPAAPPPRHDDGLPEYRVRQLYVEYVEAKRRQKESTAALTYEGLAESLRSSSARLREKHGKPVDFEVGIKDGKAVLRPRVK